MRRREVLDDVIRAEHLVRHTIEGETRERLREAFNTPLFPMVLVANEVMQEGLDLHHHCRRVVHHDLAWNPAQLEQRVGRVDRLGSLIQRLRDRKPETTLDVLMPLVANTIDERLERTVRLRERWLEFLLGAAPPSTSMAWRTTRRSRCHRRSPRRCGSISDRMQSKTQGTGVLEARGRGARHTSRNWPEPRQMVPAGSSHLPDEGADAVLALRVSRGATSRKSL